MDLDIQPGLVSIVLPTHNGQAYLREALNSCIAQTYASWELIAVDDASIDNTPGILRAFAASDPRIRVLRHDSNVRLPRALNSGFELARGEYLTWTSDDNLYRPNALAEMVAFLRANSATGMVYTDYSVIDENGEVVSATQVRDIEFLAEENFVGACFMYRHSVAAQIGDYATDLFLAEDWDYWFRISGSFEVSSLHHDLYLYRRHGASLTARRREEVDAAACKVLERNLKGIRWTSQRLRARTLVRIAIAAADRGERSALLRHLLAAVVASPRIVFSVRPILWAKAILPASVYQRLRHFVADLTQQTV